jgi:hypothetical protein
LVSFSVYFHFDNGALKQASNKKIDFPTMVEFLELNTNWKVYHMFIKEFVRIVLGKKVWKHNSYSSNLSEYCMASGEAFCLLVVENNYEWWTDMVRSGDQGDKYNSAPVPLYTNAWKSNQKKWGCKTISGLDSRGI